MAERRGFFAQMALTPRWLVPVSFLTLTPMPGCSFTNRLWRESLLQLGSSLVGGAIGTVLTWPVRWAYLAGRCRLVDWVFDDSAQHLALRLEHAASSATLNRVRGHVSAEALARVHADRNVVLNMPNCVYVCAGPQ